MQKYSKSRSPRFNAFGCSAENEDIISPYSYIKIFKIREREKFGEA